MFLCAVSCYQPGAAMPPAACMVQLREVLAWSRDVPAALAGTFSDEGRAAWARIHSPPNSLSPICSCSGPALSKSTVMLSPNSPNSTSDFQGTELRLCSVWQWKAKNSIEPLSSLFIISSGLEPKAASLVLENSNGFPLHCVYLKRNKDN